MTTHSYTRLNPMYRYVARKHWNKNVSDRCLIIYADAFKKFKLDYVMSNVTLFLQLHPGDYKRAEYYDRDRQYCMN